MATWLPDIVNQGGGFMDPSTLDATTVMDPKKSWDFFGLEPNSALQLNPAPAATWKDSILSALRNPGLMGMVAKMGSAMVDPRSPMKAIGAGVGDIGTVMQYNNAMKKLGMGGVGDVMGSGPSQLASGGSALDVVNRLMSGGMGFQGSPSTGLSGADVIGLPIDVVKDAYTAAAGQEEKRFRRGIDLGKLAVDALANQSLAKYHDALIKQAEASATSTKIKSEKEQKLEQNWSSYVEGLKSGKLPAPTGIDKTVLPFLEAVDPANGTDLVNTILKANKSGKNLHFMSDDKNIYAFDPETAQLMKTFPITKKSQETETEKAWKNTAKDRMVASLFYPMVKENIQKNAGGDMRSLAAMLESLNSKAGAGGVSTDTFRAYLTPEQSKRMDKVAGAMAKVHAEGGSVDQINQAGLSAFDETDPLKANSKAGAGPSAPFAGKELKALGDSIVKGFAGKAQGNYDIKYKGKPLTIWWNGAGGWNVVPSAGGK